jgi:hypothetical protein
VLRGFCPILFILKILSILSKIKGAAAWRWCVARFLFHPVHPGNPVHPVKNKGSRCLAMVVLRSFCLSLLPLSAAPDLPPTLYKFSIAPPTKRHAVAVKGCITTGNPAFLYLAGANAEIRGRCQ